MQKTYDEIPHDCAFCKYNDPCELKDSITHKWCSDFVGDQELWEETVDAVETALTEEDIKEFEKWNKH